MPGRGKPIRTEHERAVARHLLEDIDDVDTLGAGLLEGSPAERLGGDLAGQHDDRNGIRVRGRDTRDQVGCPGTRGPHAGAESAARARVAVRHEGGARLVLRHHDLGSTSNGGGEEREHGTADYPEDVANAGIREGVGQVLGRRAPWGRPDGPISIGLGAGPQRHSRVIHHALLVAREPCRPSARTRSAGWPKKRWNRGSITDAECRVCRVWLSAMPSASTRSLGHRFPTRCYILLAPDVTISLTWKGQSRIRADTRRTTPRTPSTLSVGVESPKAWRARTHHGAG